MSTNLDKLMQMATLEQMNNMIQQMNKKTESEAKDVLSLPIVQKVIMAYEDELKVKKGSNECKCNCKCDELIPTILGHLNDHNLKLQLIENRLNGLFTLLENREPEKPVIDKNQTKLTSFPGFSEIPEVIKNVSLQKSFLPEENSLESQQSCLESPCLEKENITLNIEETEPENNNIDIIEDFDDEDIQESTDTEDVDQVQTETVEEEDKSEEEDEAVEEENEAVEEEDEEAAEDKVAIEDEAVEEDEEDDESHENVSTEEEVATEDELEDQVELIKEDETVEEDEEDEAEEDKAEEDEAEEEVFEIEIDDITYFATDEENGILYEVDKDGEVGKKVGIIKDGEPIFS